MLAFLPLPDDSLGTQGPPGGPLSVASTQNHSLGTQGPMGGGASAFVWGPWGPPGCWVNYVIFATIQFSLCGGPEWARCVGGHCPSPFPPLPFHLSAGQPKARPALGEKGEGGRGRGKDAHVAQNAVQPSPPPLYGGPLPCSCRTECCTAIPPSRGVPPMPGCAGSGGGGSQAS